LRVPLVQQPVTVSLFYVGGSFVLPQAINLSLEALDDLVLFADYCVFLGNQISLFFGCKK